MVPRPPFDCDGYWLYGYGLSLHLVATDDPEGRRLVKKRRIQHFSSSLPRFTIHVYLHESCANSLNQ